MLPVQPPFHWCVGADGTIALQCGEGDDLPPLSLGLPLPRKTPEDARKELEDEFLTYRLEGEAGDVAKCGHLVITTCVGPLLRLEPFAPSTTVESILPDEDGRIGYRVVPAQEAEAGSLLRRPHAAQASREYMRGSLGSLPFAPGGEELEATTSATDRAAAEAASGAWLRELEEALAAGVPPPRACAPGLPHGAFGAWALPETGRPPGSGASPAAATLQTAGQAALGNGSVDPTAPSGAADVAELLDVDAVQAAGANILPPSPARLSGRAPAGAATVSPGRTMTLSQKPTLGSKAAAAGAEWAVRGGVRDLDAEFERLRPNLAHNFPFELDRFQKEAVVHLERGHSVFVAAHTSAGKTMVAEYALALAARHCTRAIYTSPIKTISNQKFRDFTSQFEVGLLTGDASIKPEAAALIMTTEILRSMLYKGADVIRDVEWVIFDEVHYVNDAERGVVWEEVIIMLPAHVNLILLSATVPNVMEFAGWVGRTKRKVLYVTGTTKRPVPLEHSLYFAGQLYPICRGDTFLPEGAAQARLARKKKIAVPETRRDEKRARPTGRGDGGPGAGRGRGASHGRGGGGGGSAAGRAGGGRGGGANSNSGLRSERSAWTELINDLKKKTLLPMVCFCFSKKRVDLLADNLSGLDLTSAAEKAEVHLFCDRSLARLRGGDRELPQILRVRAMLKRGLGVHHAGLLPIVKEVVEMLFCRGLIKVLFSTETFAMGVNAPARTVIFQSLRKHDGTAFRTLLAGEYTQMAGRAGRRGLDKVGTVIVACWEDIPDEGELRRLLTGRATQLESRFRLTYSMILNLLRVEDLKVEDMLKRSFAEFHAQRAAPEAREALAAGKAALAALRARPWPASRRGTPRAEVERYWALTQRIEALDALLQDATLATRGAQQALVPGRVVLIRHRASGLSELGAVCGAPAAGGSRSAGLAGSSGGSAAAGRQYYVLSLPRPSPQRDEAGGEGPAGAWPANGAGAAAAPPTASGAGGDFEAPPGFVLRVDRSGTGAGPGPLPRRGEVGGVPFTLQEVAAGDIEAICRARLKADAAAALDAGDRQAAAAVVRGLQRVAEEAEASEAGDPPVLDPVADLKLHQLELVETIHERQALLQERAALPCHREPALGEMFAAVRSEALLSARLNALTHQLSDASLAQMPEFRQRVEVLRRLGYIAQDNTVQLKGRVACEMNSGDELVATELIFAGVLAELAPEEAVALLSALVFQEKSEIEAAPPTEALAEACQHAAALAWQAGQAQQDCGLDILPDEFVRSTLRFGLVEVVYEWAKGTPFKDICELTDVMEGSIVRAVVRLDETCREFRDAARVMGNVALFQQMEAAQAAIKRDVVPLNKDTMGYRDAS
ncbi:hypothetical protein WJX81_007278 [Elliptochloris bilobata]|uniref:Antiviral helicase n=1 Tax=Elliptochloris bilobata TaxID=381761 RepID=A0AAW1R1M1_9CHLO